MSKASPKKKGKVLRTKCKSRPLESMGLVHVIDLDTETSESFSRKLSDFASKGYRVEVVGLEKVPVSDVEFDPELRPPPPKAAPEELSRSIDKE